MAGVRVGLNYPAVDVRISKIPDYVELPLHLQSDVWQGLAVMERACLTVWSEQSNE